MTEFLSCEWIIVLPNQFNAVDLEPQTTLIIMMIMQQFSEEGMTKNRNQKAQRFKTGMLLPVLWKNGYRYGE